MQDQLERRVVGPVDVVEHQDERPLAREQLEQGSQRAVVAEALGRTRDGRGLDMLGDRRQDGRELRLALGSERLEPARVKCRDVVVEGVGGQAERQVALVLRGAPLQHQQPRRLRTLAQLRQQGALSDAGLAEHPEQPLVAGRDLLQGALDRGHLGLAAQQALALRDHGHAPRLVAAGRSGTLQGSPRDIPDARGGAAGRW
jgi:hypothetical protein